MGANQITKHSADNDAKLTRCDQLPFTAERVYRARHVEGLARHLLMDRGVFHAGQDAYKQANDAARNQGIDAYQLLVVAGVMAEGRYQAGTSDSSRLSMKSASPVYRVLFPVIWIVAREVNSPDVKFVDEMVVEQPPGN